MAGNAVSNAGVASHGVGAGCAKKREGREKRGEFWQVSSIHLTYAPAKGARHKMRCVAMLSGRRATYIHQLKRDRRTTARASKDVLNS